MFFEADVRSSKLELLRDVNITRISDTLSYSFPQTVTEIFSKSQISGMKIDITPIRPRGLSGLDDQIHSCHSETSYPMMPKLCDFQFLSLRGSQKEKMKSYLLANIKELL